MLSPYIELRIGNTSVIDQCSALDIWLYRKEPADVCEFALKTGLPDLGLVKDTPIEVHIGYSNDSWKVFSGYVTEPHHPRYLCKDEAVKLFETKIIQTFLKAKPQDVIKHALTKAGITKMNLDPAAYTAKPRFVASGENISDLVRRINTTWQLTNDWYFDDDTFVWMPNKPRTGDVYSYQYEQNIIDLTFSTDRDAKGQRSIGTTSGSGKLLTVVSPFVKHSQEVEIIWPEIKATRFMVETVHHFRNQNGGLRTELYFRELEAA